jgi:hypothetical protein
MKHFRTGLPRFVVAGVLAISLAGPFAGVAWASGRPAGTDSSGACHMLGAWGAGANGGMARAMTVNAVHGKGDGTPGQIGGMWGAVLESGCTL